MHLSRLGNRFQYADGSQALKEFHQFHQLLTYLCTKQPEGLALGLIRNRPVAAD